MSVTGLAELATDELERRRDRFAELALCAEYGSASGMLIAGLYAAQANFLNAEIERRAAANAVRAAISRATA